MYKKNDGYAETGSSSRQSHRTEAVSLSSLISRMQRNADQVEKNLLLVKEKLALDSESMRRGLSAQYQKQNNDWIQEADDLLTELFLDLEQAKNLGHPQVAEIEQDIRKLKEQYQSDNDIFSNIYKQTVGANVMSKVDWPVLLSQKQRQVNTGEYGPSPADVEQQIASHNILHKEIEAYRPLLEASDSSSPATSSTIQKQYKSLLESSQQRSCHLGSLCEYLLACGRETAYLRIQQEKVLKQDWSDRNISFLDVCQLDENFKSKSVQSHESEATKLESDGARLVQAGHPASSVIKAHRNDLHAEWQKFLSLCGCREKHIDNLKDYKKFQADAETLSSSLRKLSTNLDLMTLSHKTNADIQRQLEGDESLLKQSEELLADLKKRSTTVVPLRSRRRPPIKATAAVSLCDWGDGNNSVTKGERFGLQSNFDPDRWNVQASNGVVKVVPGACLVVPPPDPEVSDRVDRLERDLQSLKKKQAALQSTPRSSRSEVVRTQNTVLTSRSADDSRVQGLSSQLDRISDDLERAKRDTLGRLRPPLDHKDRVQDLSNRLKEQEQTSVALRNLGEETAAAQREIEVLSSLKPSDSVISAMCLKLNTTKNKHDNVTSLADLFTKKANASVYLENQMEKVDVFVSGFENQLAEELPLLDKPGAIQSCNAKLQRIRKNVAAKDRDLQQLGHDLEAVEQLCSSLQAAHQEYCPDSGRQNSEVQTLRKRYSNIENQLRCRQSAIQDIASKNQAFQSAAQTLTSFLNNVPSNRIYPNNSQTQISNMINSQTRVVEDIRRRKDDLDRMTDASLDLQNILLDYDSNCDQYRSIVDDSGGSITKQVHSSTLAESVQDKERSLRNHFSEVVAENEQRLRQMEVAKNRIVQNGDKATPVVIQQRVYLQSQQKNTDEVDGLKQDLTAEIARRSRAEDELVAHQKRMISLKSRRGVERLEEKEVLHYYRDPTLESNLQLMLSRIHDEELKHSGTKAEIELINKKIVFLENELKNVTPKLMTKEMTEIERDPKLDMEASRLREELRKLKEEIRTRESEIVHMKTEITVLDQKKPVFKERVVKKEVVRLEKNPELVHAVSVFQAEIAHESDRCKTLNDEIFQTRRQINVLERMIPTIAPKVIIKEVKNVVQDSELVSEAKRLTTSLEEERMKHEHLMEEITKLQLSYVQTEKLQQKVEVKETTKEIYRVDPETEMEIVRLKKDLQNLSVQRSNLQQEISLVVSNLDTFRSQKPKVEVKEVTHQVVKEEVSPEVIREVQRLKDQLSLIQRMYDSSLEKVTTYRKDRDEWKAKNSKVETQIITRETVRYENDPLIEKEAERLRRELRDETQRRRTIEEMVFNLQHTYLELERQKPEERVVMQELVRLQKDPKQILEHERLNKMVDEEVKSRRMLELDVKQLRTLLKEKEMVIAQMDERKKKIQVETELRQIKTRISELENTPPVVKEKVILEEVVKVERDPTVDKLVNDLSIAINKERNLIKSLELDTQRLTKQLEVLHKEKSVERTVYKEVIRVERDETVETERAHLRERMSIERNSRKNVEDEIERLSLKLKRLQTLKETSTREMESLTHSCSLLLKEKENLSQEIRQMQSRKQEVSISFQQESQLLTERNYLNKQRSEKLEAEVQQLEKHIMEERDKIRKRELLIKELQGKPKEEHTEITQRMTNVSTRITILDPDTGKDMSPYDAYTQGLIDKNHYLHLQTLECDWEEIAMSCPEGETFMLRDRKSGKQYAIENALKDGRLTQYDLQRYREGKIPISEFALLVAGETKTKTTFLPEPKTPLTPQKSSLSSNSKSTFSNGEDFFPIVGLYDTTTNTKMSVRSGMTRNLVDPDLGLKLLEAQAATGGIVDISNRTRFSVHKAAASGLIERTMMQQLLNAQKAFTGIEDPMSKSRLSVGQAILKGWIPKESGMRFMEAQVLTGGLVDPNQPGRIPVSEAQRFNLVDNEIAEMLKDESKYPKYLVDPITKEKISYKEAMDRCKKDPSMDLLLLPVASNETNGATQSYSSRSSSSYSSVPSSSYSSRSSSSYSAVPSSSYSSRFSSSYSAVPSSSSWSRSASNLRF